VETYNLRANHPREQGLKLHGCASDIGVLIPSSESSKRTRIETAVPSSPAWPKPTPSSESSKRTRIETPQRPGIPSGISASSESSKRTRIETHTAAKEIEVKPLRANHPREQGLKPDYYNPYEHPILIFERIIQENKD